jgi:hypothetical protein
MSLLQLAVSIIENAFPGIYIKEISHVNNCRYYFTSICGKRGYVSADTSKIKLMDEGQRSMNLLD